MILTAVALAGCYIPALRGGKESFEGEDPCRGQVGTADCARIFRYSASATYKA